MLLYWLSLLLYRLAVGLVSLYNGKARKWVAGRRNWRQHIASHLAEGEKRIWVHCSSLGEFEQGRPLIEQIKEQYPGYKVVLTFFSPSGYEACRHYSKADYVFYLPLDGPAAARDFVSAIDPALVIFVKYEFWYYFLREVCRRGTPLLLVSAAFRPAQAFFSWYGGFFRKILRFFTHIHVQDNASATLLEGIGIKSTVSVTGDTRYDRVTAIAQSLRELPFAVQFKGGHKLLIAGSTWPADESLLKDCISALPSGWKLMIAPHEIDEKHTRQVQALFGSEAVLYSNLSNDGGTDSSRVLIIDNIGMLSSLYRYADIAYVGGGFARGGIHNTLEPAIFGLPVIMGPVYEKFVEAVGLVGIGAAFPVNNAREAGAVLARLAGNDVLRHNIRDNVKHFMEQNTGAAGRILQQISASGWLSR